MPMSSSAAKRRRAGGQALPEEEHSHDQCPQGPDARPDGVGCAQGQGAGGPGQQQEAGRHPGEGQNSAEGLGEALRQLHEGGPEDLQPTGGDEDAPRHDTSFLSLVVSRAPEPGKKQKERPPRVFESLTTRGERSSPTRRRGSREGRIARIRGKGKGKTRRHGASL